VSPDARFPIAVLVSGAGTNLQAILDRVHGRSGERDVSLVVLAGFMELLTPSFLAAFPNRIINVHPALLPAFPGARPVDDQIAYGVKVGGVTVHFVDEGVDSGPIILQEPVRISDIDGRDAILDRIHEVEHELLPRAIRLMALGAVSFDADNPRVVHVDESVLKGGEHP
jgi:phosphoribosylglycinamide formyltransferase-1